MLQPGGRPGLLGKPVREGGVVHVVGRQHLDGHITVQGRIVGAEYRGHAALTNLIDYPVSSQTAPWSNRHHMGLAHTLSEFAGFKSVRTRKHRP